MYKHKKQITSEKIPVLRSNIPDFCFFNCRLNGYNIFDSINKNTGGCRVSVQIVYRHLYRTDFKSFYRRTNELLMRDLVVIFMLPP